MTVTVAMGYWRCPDFVGRAVRSVLAQTHADLRCVVIGDGEEPPLDIHDERLTVYTLPENHGAYFALQLALLASPDAWFAPFGADDWAEPDHLERLLDMHSAAAIPGAVFTNAGKVHKGPYEVGVFRRERLMAIGGYNPAERIGQDTLLIRLLRLTGDVAIQTTPTYHRVKRSGSLTTSSETGFGSPARTQMRERNRSVYAKCRSLQSTDEIRRYRESIVPLAITADLSRHATALSERLALRAAA